MKHVKEMSSEECVHEFINKAHRMGTLMRAMGCDIEHRLHQARLAKRVASTQRGDAGQINAMFSAYFDHGELSDADEHLELTT